VEHVVFWILDIWVPNLLGASILQAVNQFGNGLIGHFAQMIGFNSLQEQSFFISLAPHQIARLFG